MTICQNLLKHQNLLADVINLVEDDRWEEKNNIPYLSTRNAITFKKLYQRLYMGFYRQ